jgi:hypothetical protein
MITQYQRQLTYIFDRPTIEPAWFWTNNDSDEAVFDDNPLSVFTFIEKLLVSVKSDLSVYSDGQIGLGLTYIFDSACSNMAHDFKIAEVSVERKVTALCSIFNLFRDVFNPRCEALISASSQEKISQLNYICYMFWDVCPLAIWKDFTKTNPDEIDSEAKIYYKTVAEVMKKCLSLSNQACVESGLHGLGHMVYSLPEIAVPIIDNYLTNKKNNNEILLKYAEKARTGMIA